MGFLPNAYAIELVQWSFAFVAILLYGWNIGDSWLDYREAYKNSPYALMLIARGNLLADSWRLFECAQLLGIGTYAVLTTSPIIGQREFWDWDSNTNVWRVLVTTITMCKVAASLTDRWYRQQVAGDIAKVAERAKMLESQDA